MRKLKEKILNNGDKVFFTPLTEEYGLAEFQCCPIFKRGKLKEFYLHPDQQPDAKYYYKLDLNYSPYDFSIGSWTHKGIDSPQIWLHYWCKEHKCHGFRFYVPRNSNFFEVHFLSNLSINFGFEEKSAE